MTFSIFLVENDDADDDAVQVLHARYLLQLLHETRGVLRTFPTVMHVSTLSAQRVTVCGDLHGKLNDLLLIFWKVEMHTVTCCTLQLFFFTCKTSCIVYFA